MSTGRMDQSKKVVKIKEEQFEYQGRWVDKSTFRAFVFDKDGNQKLANSYNEYEDLVTSGIWFESKPQAQDASNKHILRKQKHDSVRADD